MVDWTHLVVVVHRQAAMIQQPKRRRTNDEESSSNPTMLNVSQLKPHETVWFNDGNIVLATDVHLYRVHKGVLAKSSSVFKDMLDLASGSDERGEKDAPTGGDWWNGIPLVRMVDDTDESVYHLLMTLYDRDYYRGNKITSFSTVVSLLRMSTKYDVSSVRREVVDQLSHIYPRTLEEWESPDIFPLEYLTADPLEYFTADGEFSLLAAARECDVPILLPCLFYCCACEKLDTILKSSGQLRGDDFRRLILGREVLSKYSFEFGARALFPQDQCNSNACATARAKLLILWMDFTDIDYESFSLSSPRLRLEVIRNSASYEEVCDACEEKSDEAVEAVRMEFWESLPATFELDDWEKVTSKV